MTQQGAIRRAYPWKMTIEGKEVTFRMMTPGDGAEVLQFARRLPEDDLMFLRSDITQQPAVDAWMAYIKSGRTISIVAEIGGEIAGYASLHKNEANWMRHVGEMRVLVGRDYRGLLSKVTAQMSTDQRGARQVFEHLGFRPEALLADHVMTRDGQTRDMLIMSYDVAGFSNDR
jgi:RimJ/RimL family protein N-acetyltransferase